MRPQLTPEQVAGREHVWIVGWRVNHHSMHGASSGKHRLLPFQDEAHALEWAEVLKNEPVNSVVVYKSLLEPNRFTSSGYDTKQC